MLSSKYAPVVALTALGIVVIALLGWFLAIKPQVDAAAAFGADEDLVVANVATIQTDSAAIAQAQSELGEAVDLGPSIELNAPPRLNIETVRARIAEAIVDSGVEIANAGQEPGALVPGWEVPPALLPSTDVAKRFQSGPAPTTEIAPETFTPVVAVQGEAQVRAQGLAMVPLEMTVVGTPEETYDFIASLRDESLPFLQIFEMEMGGLVSGSPVFEGVSEPNDGDVQTFMKLATYLSDVDVSSLDEGPVSEATVPNDSPFIAPEEDAPEQPGAN